MDGFDTSDLPKQLGTQCPECILGRDGIVRVQLHIGRQCVTRTVAILTDSEDFERDYSELTRVAALRATSALFRDLEKLLGDASEFVFDLHEMIIGRGWLPVEYDIVSDWGGGAD